MRRLAIVSFAVFVVVLAAWKLVPFWTTPAPTVDSTPVAVPLANYAEINLREGDVACVKDVILGPSSRYLRFLTSVRGPTSVRAAVTAGSYRSRAVSTAVNQQPLTFTIDPPQDEIAGAKVCLEARQSRQLVILGIPASQITSDSYTTVNGKRSKVNATLTVLESTGSTRIAGLPATVRHAAAISPLPGWLIWIIFFLATVGALAALAYGLGESAQDLPARREGDVK